MAVKNVTPIPLNSVWAIDTPNKMNLNDDDRNQGLVYQSMVISNQINGALYQMSDALRFNQLTGGYYVPGQRYFVGQIVKMKVIENASYPPSMRFFECIADNNGNGIVDVLPYNVIQSFTDLGGVRCYTVNPSDANTTNWRMLVGNEELLKEYIQAKMNELKGYVNTQINTIRNEVRTQLQNQQTQFQNQIIAQQNWVNNRIAEITDRWKNLGNVSGGTYNLVLNGPNNSYNNFIITFSGNTNLGTINYSGARERSGCLLINSGANYVKRMFTNAYNTVLLPFNPTPSNSSNGSKIWLFYKLHPSYGVCFTRG